VNDIKIKKGTTFRHRKVTCHTSKSATNRCVVTAVRRGLVYYRFENEIKGNNTFFIENLHTYAEDIQCPQ
jgi:hypothetical protein